MCNIPILYPLWSTDKMNNILNQIWLPTLVFSNTEQNDITEGDEKSQLIAGRRTPAR